MLIRYIPKSAGRCAKTEVIATITDIHGVKYESSNFCLNPQTFCPRVVAGMQQGEGYKLCKDICNQPAHAEVNAIQLAKILNVDLSTSTLEVAHDWVCGSCESCCVEHKLTFITKGESNAGNVQD